MAYRDIRNPENSIETAVEWDMAIEYDGYVDTDTMWLDNLIIRSLFTHRAYAETLNL
jgi:hypothetical protein